MAGYAPDAIRNLALVGHGKCGKTTLAEAVLHHAGATARLGRVDEGTTVSDFDEDEKERGVSIDAAVLHCEHDKCLLNIIDTPGYSDFIGQTISAMAAADTVVLCVSAVAGIEVNTRKCWDLAGQMGRPRAMVITKIDGDNANFEDVVQSIQELYGPGCVPVQLPVGEGRALQDVVDVLTLAEDLPGEIAERATEAHASLVDPIVESNDELLEKYLEEGEISDEELLPAVSQAIAGGTFVPIFCCAGEKGVGVDKFLDAIVKCFPSAASAEGRKGVDPRTIVESEGEGEEGEEGEVEPQEKAFDKSAEAPFSAQVFRVIVDPFVGKMSCLRVFSGSLSAEAGIYNLRTGKRERMGGLFRLQGGEQVPIPSASAGEIVAVSKVEDVVVSDTVCDEKDPIKYEEIRFPTPMVSLAVEPKARGDEQKISAALPKLAEGDPTFRFLRDRQTKELVVTGLSSLHLDISLARLKRRYGVEVLTKDPKIPYLETITGSAEGHYRHKKQTGGRGQYGEVYIRITPRERGAGFEFVNSIVGASIPNQFIPAVEKGLREVIETGVIAGYPVVDVQVELYDGTYHTVDSSEIAFKISASRAFSEGVRSAKPVLLEPIVKVEITVPERYMGDVTSDLSGRRGRPQGMDSVSGMSIITAEVPLGEVSRYSTELRSLTGGEGSYAMEFSHYDIVPARIQQALVEKAKEPAEKE